MQAVILAGGEGTRLRPLTLTRPKPALPLVDRPFIRYVVDWVARHGVDEAVIACGFGSDVAKPQGWVKNQMAGLTGPLAPGI